MTKILREPICSLAGSAPPRSLFPMNYLNPASSARAHLVRVHPYTRARSNAFSLARYASRRRRRLEMEMEVEVCHRVNGPLSFLHSPSSSSSSSCFQVASYFRDPSGSMDALASDTNCYLFVEPCLACHLSPYIPSSSSLCVSTIAPRTQCRTSRAAKAPFY